MRIDTEAFLAMTALIAATAVPGCSSDKGNSGDNDSGVNGTGATGSGGKGSGGKGNTEAGTGGTSGKGGSGGDGGKGGSTTDAGEKDAGPDSGNVEAGPDSGPGYCIGDTVPTLPDAGKPDAASEGVADPCNALPAAADGCASDAGGESFLAPAYAVCSDLQYTARPGIFDSVVKCLVGATRGYPACGKTATTLAVACYDATVALACPVPLPDGGVGSSCDTFVKGCHAVTAKQCNGALRAFSEEGAGEFAACIDGITLIGDGGVEGGGDCATAFWSCALPGITR